MPFLKTNKSTSHFTWRWRQLSNAFTLLGLSTGISHVITSVGGQAVLFPWWTWERCRRSRNQSGLEQWDEWSRRIIIDVDQKTRCRFRINSCWYWRQTFVRWPRIIRLRMECNLHPKSSKGVTNGVTVVLELHYRDVQSLKREDIARIVKEWANCSKWGSKVYWDIQIVLSYKNWGSCSERMERSESVLTSALASIRLHWITGQLYSHKRSTKYTYAELWHLFIFPS